MKHQARAALAQNVNHAERIGRIERSVPPQ
jgi:hypothetical protein